VKTYRLSNDSYRLINLIFAGIILAIFAYSLFYGGEKTHPIPSAMDFLTGQASVSTGLSRSFSAIVRFDFSAARAYNPYGLRIFMFFLIQMVMRISGFMIAGHLKRNRIINLDIVISIAMFIVFFWPFLKAAVKSV